MRFGREMMLSVAAGIGLAAAGALEAQVPSILGDFSGDISVQGQKLPLILHLAPTGASFDSPAQGAAGLPLTIKEQTAASIWLDGKPYGLEFVLSLALGSGELKGELRQSGQVFPIVFVPLKAGASPTDNPARAGTNRPQMPKAPFPYNISQLTFPSADGQATLAGTLTIPPGDGKVNAVVLVTGSGPQDRDETLAGHKPFWVIADALSRAGIAVLRYDDRGVAASKGDFAAATTADFVQDAQGALVALRQALGVRAGKIGLIGHSEGGLVGPAVQASFHSLDFLVLLAGPGMDIDQLMLRQNADIARQSGMSDAQVAATAKINAAIYAVLANPAPVPDQERQIRSILSTAGLATPQLEQTMAPILTPWFRYFMAIKPSVNLAKVTVPVFALNGSKDTQVWSVGNLAAIRMALEKGGNRNIVTKEYPGLNHLFQHAGSGLPAEYAAIEETIAPEVLADLAAWISTGKMP